MLSIEILEPAKGQIANECLSWDPNPGLASTSLCLSFLFKKAETIKKFVLPGAYGSIKISNH